MNLRPLHDQVAVKQNEAEETSKGGIVIANTTEKPLIGEVLAVGPGRYLDSVRCPMTVSVGDKVMFGKQAGTEVELDKDTTVLMLHESEIVAILE